MEAPKLPTIFKQNRSRGFNYQPLYYDEKKERAEEIRRQIAGGDTQVRKENFRAQMRAEIHRSAPQHSNRASNLRLLVIIMVLLAIAYLIIKF